MLIRLGYDISFDVPLEVPIVALLNVYQSRFGDLREPDVLRVEPEVKIDTYTDVFGNQCSRFVAPPGTIRLYNSTLIEDAGTGDEQNPDAPEIPVGELPTEVLQYLLASRYCEVDLLSNTAVELFGDAPRGWQRVKTICDWIQSKVTFGYNFARSTKTALDVYTERLGVCRDFQHLAITFCRSLNIPARYVTGYLGDIGVPAAPYPMDFSAWFEAYLGGRWYTFDARHNRSRIGRVLMAVGRDAADVALTTSFGSARLKNFTVITDEVKNGG
ncbi:MAG: transglutaminase family protein [Acidobacteriaceae bacterium]|nr:transglutaminase family protein [Acidobacteriaceae bacterium]MBV9224083.1 transglutaminase family protein [Acidobacteriaceae bacterium]MBV9304788.1 transglutaminase family protein [Acidobacteriaceae bacterium]MBV9679917.1 transglutaminase family protein [Acidobacteriaceae bacterium]